MKYIDNISLIDIRNKKILLCVSKGETKWQLPGGKRELGEDDEETLIRECKEELNIDLIPETIKLFETIQGQAHSKDKGVIVKIKMFTANFTGVIVSSTEIEKAEYLGFDQVPDTSEIGWSYLKGLKEKGLIK